MMILSSIMATLSLQRFSFVMFQKLQMNMHSQYLRKYMALPSFRGGEGFCMLLIKFRFTFLGVENSVLAAFRMPHVKFSQYPTGTNCQKKQTCFLWLGEETKQNWLQKRGTVPVQQLSLPSTGARPCQGNRRAPDSVQRAFLFMMHTQQGSKMLVKFGEVVQSGLKFEIGRPAAHRGVAESAG